MNISKILLTGTIACMALASCTNENDYLNGIKPESGTMLLEVSQLLPKPKSASVNTRAVDTSNFPVAVFRASDNEKVQSYEQASLVPNKVLMPTGNYYATAHTPGVMEKIMDAPYFSGRQDFQIAAGLSTETKVVCRMANGSITVKLSDDFSTAFKEWNVTINDASNTAIIYTQEDGLTPATKYIDFEENTSELKLNFRATTTDGGRITSNTVLTKKNANAQYEGDSENFSGGDAIVVNLKPAASTEGELTGIDINANISFEESEEDFEMEVEDVVQGGGDNPGSGGETTNDVTLNLPPDMEVDFFTDASAGDTYMASPNGLKSVRVVISSTSQELIGALEDLDTNYGVNFLTGVEVVENRDLVEMFKSMQQTLAVPTTGDTEYTFPIGNFFSMISLIDGDHTINVEVTDMKGNTKKGKVVLTVKPW